MLQASGLVSHTCTHCGPIFHINVKENQHATRRSLLVVKQKDFSDQNQCIDSQPEKSLNEDGWCRTKHRVTELHGRQTAESSFLRFACQRKTQRKLCWYVKFLLWKGEFWIQEVIRRMK